MTRLRRHRNYLSDYGGPLVRWPEAVDQAEPIDWAALFPAPLSARLDIDGGTKRQTNRQFYDGCNDVSDDESGDASDYDDYEDDDSDFWLSPRMACMLHYCTVTYIDTWCDFRGGDMALYREQLPEIVKPYTWSESWTDAYRQAAMRIVMRLQQGKVPHPNCTAEEMVLHKIIDMARDFLIDDEDMKDGFAGLPVTTKDEDFELILELLVEDDDVLMLYEMPHLADPGNLTAIKMDIANLHPDKWFQPFKPWATDNHAL